MYYEKAFIRNIANLVLIGIIIVGAVVYIRTNRISSVDIGRARDEVARITGLYTAAQARVKSAEKSIEELESDNRRITEEHRQLRSDYTELETEAGNIRSQSEKLRAELGGLKGTIDRIEEQLVGITDIFDFFKVGFTGISEILQHLRIATEYLDNSDGS